MNERLLTIKAVTAAALLAVWRWAGWRGPVIIAWLVVMILDYISGSIAAAQAGEWSSKVARAGIIHKVGMIFAVVVSGLADWVMAELSSYIQFSWPGLLMPLVLAWYIVTELGSILENAVKMGAPVPKWLVKILKITADMMENAGESAVTGNKNE